MVAMMQQQTFAQLLRAEREARDWTQEELAAKIPVHTHTVYRWEAGTVVPGTWARRGLCRVFGWDRVALRELCRRECRANVERM